MTMLNADRELPYSVKPAQKPKAAPARRDYDLDFKLKVVKESLAPGASVSRIARRHDLNSNMVFRWRREYRSGDLTSRLGACAAAEKDFVPVGVVDSQGALLMLPAPNNASADADAAAKSNSSKNRPGGGVIEIVLPNGIRVRVGAHVEDQALSRVVSAMKEIP